MRLAIKAAPEPIIQQPIDIDYLSRHGLPIKYGNKIFVLPGQKLADLTLRELRSARAREIEASLN